MISKAIDILQAAQAQGVHIFLDNGQLQLKYAKEKGIDAQLLTEIKTHKELIITFLTDTQGATNNQEDGLEIKPVERTVDQRIPLSFGQERLWFIDRLEGSTQYHMPAVLRLKGKLNQASLAHALKNIVARHEVVRTVFLEEEGTAFQHINTEDAWNLSYQDGSSYKDDNVGLRKLIQQLINKPFDLANDYMLRADLITLQPDDFVLVFTLHHIASDGWSRSVLVKEVMELYSAHEEKRAPQLKPLPVQYADYSAWQRNYLSGEVLDQKLAYWKNKLDEVAPLQLPTDYTRPAIQTTKGASAYFSVDKLLSEELQEFSRKQGATIFMTLLACFKVLLYRYTSQKDICVGSPIAGRQQQELEGLIGLFANTLALRTQVDEDSSFTQFLNQVKRTTMEAQEHQDVPFERVVDAVVKERSLSRTPLTQVMFALQNTPEVPRLKLGDILFEREGFEHTTAMFDISFFINETVNGLQGIVEYSTELFNEQTVVKMMGHFKILLEAIVKMPEQKIGDLPMLDQNEETLLLNKFNDNKIDYPSGKTIINFFEEQAATSPLNIALVFDETQITYGELNERANQLARYLRVLGAKEEVLIPICIERGIEMIVGILGILKAGSAYVPIDPEYPADRISYMLGDSNATLAISSKASKSKMPAIEGLKIIELDNENTEIKSQSNDNLLINILPGQLAYVIYTSGSTGRPKGVMIEHRNVYAFICWCKQEFSTDKFEIVYASTSICFDLSVYEIFFSLGIGKTVRIIENGLHIGKYLKGDRFVLTNSVPVVIENLLKEGRDISNISVINMAGEPVPLHVQQALDTERIAVRNLYGPTEDTTYSTVYPLKNNTPILIGKPISNSSIYILNRKGKLVPVGVAGEICIGGDGVARGYLNRPELTEEKFVSDNFSKQPGAKMYRTGDLGRWLPDGNIEYMGRIDDQVKIRGFRIELGEVETVLNDLDQVSSSCVVVKKHNNSTNTLVSYFIPDGNVVKEKERELYQAQVLSWKEVYEIEYEQTEGKDDVNEEFNIIGWNDSFTGEAIPEQQMSEWVKEITDKILSVHPENVLEIGCGTGLIYYQLAGKVKKYIGTDFSKSSINQITQRIGRGLRDYGSTELFVAAAHEVALKPEETIDTIILNSIVQYFPGEEYMNDVIRNSIHLLKGKGRIIIGDVRDNRLLPLFKGRLHLNKMQQSAAVKEFKWAVDQDILKEEELCLTPEYFYRLKSVYPEITHIDITWKKASYINELSLYRFTVIVYVGIEASVLQPSWVSLAGQKDSQYVVDQINKSVPCIALKDVNNPRLWKERQLLKAMEERAGNTVADLLTAVEKEDKDNAAVWELLNLAKVKGYQYRMLVHEDPFKVNILLELESQGNFIQQPYHLGERLDHVRLTNIPLFSDISLLLQKDIRALLKQRLPEYMVPSEMMALARLPLNQNGKIDRKFLSEREDTAVINRLTYQPPGTELEAKLAGIWQDLLRIEKIGIQDNFFELGGHSLLVMRLISAVRREMDIELAIKDLFVYATIAKLAAYLETLTSTALVLPPIVPLQRPEFIPLSFSQERLWFVDRLEGSLSFHVPSVLKLSGKLNKDALAYALQTIVDRHEVLRTVFHEENGFPYQLIKEKGAWELAITDGSAYAKDTVQLREHIRQLIVKPFNLTKDYTLRAALINLAEEEHILVITLHHIASDAWSLGIMVKEVVALYKAFTEQIPVALPALPIQYADYSIWQRNYLTGELLNHKLNYWKEKLKDVEPLQLPTDFPRPPLQSTKGTTTVFNIDKHLADRLKELSQQQESTLFMTLLAAFKVLLHRYTGQQDICVGTSIAGRQQQEIEDLIGFFVNILALRTMVDPQVSFTNLLDNVKQTTLDAYEHQEVPFEKVVDAVVKERDISRSPLFQALFVMLNTPGAPETALGELSISGFGYEQTSSKYDITFFVTETPQGLTGSVEYSTELFNEQTIYRMMAHFSELLYSIVKDPSKKLCDLPMITKSELHQLLYEFNDTSSEYPKDKTIVELFEEQVAKSPDAIALIFENEQLSYRELNERSNQLAYYLKGKGVEKDNLVSISIERSIEMMVGILGILKAGGAYVPIDPEYPAERLEFMLFDTGCNLIVTNTSVKSKLPVLENINIVDLDLVASAISSLPVNNLSVTNMADSLAYVIYTSGSTGKPKGVLVTQKNVVSLVKGIDYVTLTSKDILLSTGSSSFDATTLEYWGMLLNGGRLVLCSESRLLDNNLLKEEINRRGVTKMWFTSGWFNQLIEADISLFEKLQTILVGGEKLSENHIERLRNTYPGIEIINGYGPTENTTFSLTYKISESNINKPIPIGRPLSNRTVFILDENHQLVPVGISGEICLGGDGLSVGYLNRPELTAEKFVSNSFTNEMMYKTGDTGRWLPDGNIEYLGRKDEQVKIRGYRIELGEIETILQDCHLVKQAVVVAKTDNEGTKRLVGYVVPNDEYDKQEILSYLRNKLPEYMVPALLVELDQLPLNPNGKINRKVLPDPDATEIIGNSYVAPQTENEKILANIWQTLLDIEEIGVHDNFFEIGGDSLLAIRVISAIRKQLEIEMPVSKLFEFQTIASLATQVAIQPDAGLLPAIKLGIRPERIPLSFSQERLWFIDRLEGSLQYHIPAVIRLKGNLNRKALQQSLSAIVNRHEVLRTIFLEDDGTAYQVVKDRADWELNVVDETEYSNDPKKLNNLIQQLITRPFDLSKDNMLRADLIVLNDVENVLVVTLHHIASDGWSRSILVKEVAALYSTYDENLGADLPALPIQYADFAIWQRNYLQGEVLDKKIKYWQQKLQHVEPLELLTDFPRPSVQTSHGASTGFALDKEILDALQQLSQQQGSTLYMTLLAALNVLLYRYSGQKDICVGTGIAGRQQQEVEDLIGFFVNTLAIRTTFDTTDSFTALLQEIRKNTLEAYSNQEVPFEKVVDAVIRNRDRSRNPVFQVMFVLQNTPEVPVLKLGKLEFAKQGYEHSTAQFDLSFSLTENANGLDGSLEYNTDLFKKTTIDRMLLHFKQLIISIINNPQQRLSELSMITKEEEQFLLFDLNATDTTYPRDKTIIELFEQQVKLQPDSIAIMFGQEELSYRDLNERSSQLANYLLEKGILPETNIGLLSYRGFEMIIAMLGILKCGCAYVPFNTDYPAERINYILEDAGISRIVYTNDDLLKSTGLDRFDCVHVNDSINSSKILPEINNAVGSCAYIMFTSGTTGRPKGILVNQRNIIKLVYDAGPISIQDADRVLQWSNYSFDGSTYDIYCTLLKGATLCMIEDKWASDMDELSKLITSKNITVCFITTALFNTFIDVQPSVLKGLRKILFGGELVSVAHVKKALAILGSGKLTHVYGPTETTVYACSYAIDELTEGTGIPIGKPLSNTKFIVLDKDNQLVPVGVPGELFIGGEGVAMGYVNNPALTAERFIQNPFGSDMNDRFYRTGDIVRWLPEGNIEYLSRIDDQVKIRGFRIELGEIQSLIQQSGFVSQSVIVAKENREGSKDLVAYVVPAKDFSRDTIMAFLRNSLPEYMVPGIWVELAVLPLNSNGKVDKKALPEIDVSELFTNQYVAPRNELEAKLVDIWMRLLPVKQVGINDNFFELGGHSLLAMRLISAVRKELQVNLVVKDLFMYPVIAELACHLQQQAKGAFLPAVEANARPKNIPLSFSQERLWFIDQLEGSVSYNSPTVLRLKGKLNEEALFFAIQQIITRHEVLRTVFYEFEGKPYQSVIEADDWKPALMDGSVYKDDKAGLQNFIQKLIAVPFDLSKDYMLRAQLITLQAEDYVLLVTMHHIASDGWSMPIIVKEVVELYNAFTEARAETLAPLALQYVDYAIWQRKYLEGEVMEKKATYWKKKLSGVSPLELPTDFSRPAIRTVNGASVNFMIEKELSDKLIELSNQQGTTLFMTLLATYKVMLQRYSGQQDIAVGASIANRPQQELEGLIGFFVNTLALRTEVDENLTFTELLQLVKTTVLDAYEHQDVPFEKVVEEVVKERDPSRSPLFQVMMVLLNTPAASSLGFGEVELSNEPFEIKISKFDITFHISQSPYGLPVSVVYNTDLFRQDTIIRMSGHFKQLLLAVVNDPQQTIDLLQMLTESEEQQLLLAFN